MPRATYTTEMKTWLGTHAAGTRFAALAEKFNAHFGCDYPANSVWQFCKRNGIKNNMPRGTVKGERPRLLDDIELAFVATEFKRRPLKQVLPMLNAKFGKVLTYQQLKSAVVTQQIRSGRDSQFKKGHVPWLTGTKGVAKPNSGCFTAGHVAHNRQAVGTEITLSNGYIKVKTECGWQMKHRLVWQQHNGPIPPDHRIRFLDGDRANCAIDNLALVNLAENRWLTILSVQTAPDELKESVVMLARLNAHPAMPRKFTRNKALKN